MDSASRIAKHWPLRSAAYAQSAAWKAAVTQVPSTSFASHTNIGFILKLAKRFSISLSSSKGRSFPLLMLFPCFCKILFALRQGGVGHCRTLVSVTWQGGNPSFFRRAAFLSGARWHPLNPTTCCGIPCSALNSRLARAQWGAAGNSAVPVPDNQQWQRLCCYLCGVCSRHVGGGGCLD